MDDFQKAYNKALRFLSYRQRSEKEVRDNLRKAKSRTSRRKVEQVDEGLIDRVIDKLKEQKFLNDEQFARSWIESRSRAKPRSQKLIKLELKQKGISDEIFESLIHNSEFSPRGEAGIIQSDLEMARKLVDKKMLRLQGLPIEKVNAKLQQFLLGKGFNWDTIKQVLVDERMENEV